MVKSYLEEAKDYDIKEFYLTGGEPFLNQELPDIIEDILGFGDVTVLTNATLITTDMTLRLKSLSEDSTHQLRFRVSIESPIEEENDRVRGKGSFKMAAKGIENLISAGFNPIITATMLEEGSNGSAKEFKKWIGSLGSVKPQFKTLPVVYLGRAEKSIRPYRDDERVTERCFDNFPKSNLQCSHCRMIAAEGVYVCPILIDDPEARLGKRLVEALGPYELESPACYTCRTAGLCCSNSEVTQVDVRVFYGKTDR
jgi:molybdenum cofactor biosynthesis enzyme MoaA